MPHKTIHDEDFILRYCPPRAVENGEITSFAFSEKRSDRLSVNWIECERGRSLQDAYNELACHLSFDPGGAVALLSVQQVREHLNRDRHSLNVEHKPIKDWCCHSEISSVKNNDRNARRGLVRIAEVVAKF